MLVHSRNRIDQAAKITSELVLGSSQGTLPLTESRQHIAGLRRILR